MIWTKVIWRMMVHVVPDLIWYQVNLWNDGPWNDGPVPDICGGHVGDRHQGAKVDASAQLFFTSCPSEKVCLEIFS